MRVLCVCVRPCGLSGINSLKFPCNRISISCLLNRIAIWLSMFFVTFSLLHRFLHAIKIKGMEQPTVTHDPN